MLPNLVFFWFISLFSQFYSSLCPKICGKCLPRFGGWAWFVCIEDQASKSPFSFLIVASSPQFGQEFMVGDRQGFKELGSVVCMEGQPPKSCFLYGILYIYSFLFEIILQCGLGFMLDAMDFRGWAPKFGPPIYFFCFGYYMPHMPTTTQFGHAPCQCLPSTLLSIFNCGCYFNS